jgi:threonine dehydratase
VKNRLADAFELDLKSVRDRIFPYLNKTTFVRSDALDDLLGAKIVVASETFQHTGSFKFRAAISVATHSSESHLVTVSSGNFGAALACAAKLTQKKCTVIMPSTSSAVKIASVKSYGAAVDMIDVAVTSRATRLAELSRSIENSRACSPYDDALVIAGNASLGFEILEALSPDVIVAPVGGGGLSSGIVVARDASGKNVDVVGAEPAIANDASRSLREGKRIANESEPQTIADGARTLSLGVRNFEILHGGLEHIVEVGEEEIAHAVRFLFSAIHLQVEPTGALSIGALIANRAKFSGKSVVCVASGANVDPQLYAKIISSY